MYNVPPWSIPAWKVCVGAGQCEPFFLQQKKNCNFMLLIRQVQSFRTLTNAYTPLSLGRLISLCLWLVMEWTNANALARLVVLIDEATDFVPSVVEHLGGSDKTEVRRICTYTRVCSYHAFVHIPFPVGQVYFDPLHLSFAFSSHQTWCSEQSLLMALLQLCLVLAYFQVQNQKT